MDADELQAIRASRLAELQSGSSSSPSHHLGGANDGASDGQQAQAQAQAQSARHQQLSSILSGEARDRLRRIALVKPARATGVEDLLLRMARSGQIRARVSDDELVSLLREISANESSAAAASTTTTGSLGGQQKQESGGIVNLRRRYGDESDDEWA